MRRISPKTIDKWSLKTAQFDEETPSQMPPIITQTKGYGLRSKVKQQNLNVCPAEIKQESNVSETNEEDVSTDKLMEHAESLLLRARQLVAKPAPKRKYTVDETVNVETVTDQVQLEGQENTSPVKPSCKIKCQLCKCKFFTLAKLRSHHTTDHGIVQCKSCSKCFNSKEALEQHMQQHTTDQWICDSSGKIFQYESRLLQHQTVHENESRYHCPKEGCNKKFKNVGDYNRHLKTQATGILAAIVLIVTKTRGTKTPIGISIPQRETRNGMSVGVATNN